MALYNLVDKFVNLVDERFTAEAFATGVCGANYSFDGANTIKIPSMATVPMYDYARHGGNGASRYGTPVDLQASVQKMTITQDRSFSFIVDRADNIQSQAIIDANKALSRQIDEVIVPEYDRYVFNKLASTATTAGNFSATKAAKKSGSNPATAYDLFLNAQEFLGDHMVPDEGRVAICSYAMATALKQDPNFVLASEAGMDIKEKGCIGMVDGVKILRVPSNRLPFGCAALITHPYASVAPEQLKDYKIHDNPPGINGWLVEGRMIYDCFVLNNKLNSLYYIGMDGVSRIINVETTPDITNGFKTTGAANRGTLIIQDFEDTMDVGGVSTQVTYYYRTTAKPSQPAYSGWTAGSGSSAWKLVGTAGHQATLNGIEPLANVPTTYVEVVGIVSVDSANVVAAYGNCVLNTYDALA